VKDEMESYEELSNWHRDIDDLFGSVLRTPENSLGAGYLDGKHTARTVTTLYESIFRVLIPMTSRPGGGNLLIITGNERAKRRARDTGKLSTASSNGGLRSTGVEAEKITARYEHGVLEIQVPVPAQLAGRKVPIQQTNNKKLESKAA